MTDEPATATFRDDAAGHPRPRRCRLVRAAGVWVAVLLLAVLAGCGVPIQGDAQSLPSGALPPVGSTPSATPTAQDASLYFVSGRRLEAVDGAISDRSAEGVMQGLAAGPSVERQADLRTLLVADPLTGQPLLSITSPPVDGQLTVAREEAFAQLPPNDQILLMGQIVLSMADVGISSILFTDPDGTPASRVLPDGRAVDGPAVPEEYESLVVQ